MSDRFKSLVDVVRVLASDPTLQQEYLREVGLPEGIDELALEYDAISAAAEDMLRLRELDQKQYDSVKKLEGLLSRMSGKDNSIHWTPEALFSAPQWEQVRKVAQECLRCLGASRKITE